MQMPFIDRSPEPAFIALFIKSGHVRTAAVLALIWMLRNPLTMIMALALGSVVVPPVTQHVKAAASAAIGKTNSSN